MPKPYTEPDPRSLKRPADVCFVECKELQATNDRCWCGELLDENGDHLDGELCND